MPFSTEVAWIFLKNLDNKLPKEVQRVNILFTTEREHQKTLKLGKVYEYYHSLNTSIPESTDTSASRQHFLEILSTAFSMLGNEFGWDLEAIHLAISRTEKQLQGFEYVSGYRTNSNKEFTARLKLTLSQQKLLVKAVVTGVEDNLSKEYNLLICNEKHFSWHQSIKEFGWYDEQHFGLKFFQGDLWIVVNIHSGHVQEIMKDRPRKRKKMELFLRDLKSL